MKSKNIIKPFILVGICAVVGFLLLLAVYSLPVSSMESGAKETVWIFETEGECPTEQYSLRMQDNYTDALMLCEAAYAGDERLLEKTVQAYYYSVPGKNATDSFEDIFSGTAEDVERVDYARYWHGYLVFLKPLFSIFNYAQIRSINSFVQYTLLLALLYVISKKASEALFPFAFLVFLLAPTAIGKSLQYSSVYYIMLLSTMLLLLNPKRVFDGNRVAWLFMMSGILCSFLDLLTAPTLTLTVPLVFLCLKDRERALGESIKRQLQSICGWFFGYAGMWASKWLITILAGDRHFLNSILDVVMFRTSATGIRNQSIPRLGALQYSVYELISKQNIVWFLLIYIVFLLVVLVIKRRGISKNDIVRALPFMFPMFIAVAWVMLLSNHTVVHVLFTYRTVAPIVFSALAFLSSTVESKRPQSVE